MSLNAPADSCSSVLNLAYKRAVQRSALVSDVFVQIWVSYVISRLLKETFVLRRCTSCCHVTLNQYRAILESS